MFDSSFNLGTNLSKRSQDALKDFARQLPGFRPSMAKDLESPILCVCQKKAQSGFVERLRRTAGSLVKHLVVNGPLRFSLGAIFALAPTASVQQAMRNFRILISNNAPKETRSTRSIPKPASTLEERCAIVLGGNSSIEIRLNVWAIQFGQGAAANGLRQ